jgi:hypothetical protein
MMLVNGVLVYIIWLLSYVSNKEFFVYADRMISALASRLEVINAAIMELNLHRNI